MARTSSKSKRTPKPGTVNQRPKGSTVKVKAATPAYTPEQVKDWQARHRWSDELDYAAAGNKQAVRRAPSVAKRLRILSARVGIGGPYKSARDRAAHAIGQALGPLQFRRVDNSNEKTDKRGVRSRRFVAINRDAFTGRAGELRDLLEDAYGSVDPLSGDADPKHAARLASRLASLADELDALTGKRKQAQPAGTAHGSESWDAIHTQCSDGARKFIAYIVGAPVNEEGDTRISGPNIAKAAGKDGHNESTVDAWRSAFGRDRKDTPALTKWIHADKKGYKFFPSGDAPPPRVERTSRALAGTRGQ